MHAFVHLPKTGGVTVTTMLRRSFGLRHCDVEAWTGPTEPVTPDDLRRLRWVYPRLRTIGGHRVLPHGELAQVPDLGFFTILRDPLTRTASHFQFHVQVTRWHTEDGFEAWARSGRFDDMQVRRLAGGPHLDGAVRALRQMRFVGLLERFDDSLVLLQEALPGLIVAREQRNVATDNRIKKSLLDDPDKRALLEGMNRLDLELYRVATEIFAEQVTRFGGEDAVAAAVARIAPAGRSLSLAQNRLWRNLVYKPMLRGYRSLRR